ncbi:ATP-binding protein [Hyalangium rubrum]|uniref:histidine kinase n=1 Tax=Hyalangium rubrum TaxID=3103134 RepID=A0ABU5GZ81_9BACT|nr:ATP-binding protein [Hyalangium sp. s54d21]MDY7226502.1 ATP-binding protein [Hyalangium sp. s54d21]
MSAGVLPWNEKARLEALRSYEVLDTAPEPSFDDITQLAAQLCDAPVALITLVDETRVWFKSRVGVDLREVPRETSFCTHTVQHSSLFVLPDVLEDPRFVDLQEVHTDPTPRFYMGAPLVTPEGYTLGTVCVLDRAPRAPLPRHARALEALARQVVSQLELRKMNRAQTRLIDELRATNERFEVIQRATNDIIWDWDLVGNRVSWSERVQDVLGYPASSQDSGWWYSLVHPEDRERVADSFRQAVRNGATHWSEEYRVRRANGTYARVLDRGTILRTAQGIPVRILGAVMNMSEREEMRARLAQADRMASVGTLAAGVAHEINNPLAYVIANLDYVRQEVEQAAGAPLRSEEVPQALKEAREGAERMRLIVRDLKMFSRPDDERLEPVDLHRAIDSAVTMAWNQIRHRAQLVKSYQPLPAVYANEARLGQVFLNLLVNAAQAIPEGAADRNEILVSTRVDAKGRILIEVRDTGAGIPEEIRARILEPFFTTKPQGMGTGLGLSICHGIITNLGGELQFETEVGKGTTFRVVLPPPQDTEKAVAADKPVEAAARRGRIVVVDDEQLVLNAIKRALRTEHDVTVFNRAQAALEWMEQGEPWDVLLCDLMMPEMTGMEFHAELSRRWPERLKDVVFVTGGAFTEGAREFLGQPSISRLEKPFEPPALREVVAERLKSR